MIFIRPPTYIQLDPQIIRAVCMGKTEKMPQYRFLTEAIGEERNTFSRIGAESVHLLFSWKHKIHISDNINPNASPIWTEQSISNERALIDKIRETELDYLVSRSKAKLPTTQGITYVAPSGSQVHSFLRVGNIQNSISAIDAIFFWLLPHLVNCIGIITDIWSISSIALNASRRLQVYQNDGSKSCPVEMLSRYHDGSTARAAEVAEIVEKFIRGSSDEPGQILFLMSAVHSGRLVTNVRKALDLRGVATDQVNFATIFRLSDSALQGDIAVLRDLSDSDEFKSPNAINQSGIQHVDPIQIDEGVYFPLRYQDVEHEVRISETTTRNKKFFSEYDGATMVRVHRDILDEGSRRHHGIWIDTNQLSCHSMFQKKFNAMLLALCPTPSVIITPTHRVAQQLGERACRILSKGKNEPKYFKHPNLLLKEQELENDREIAVAIDNVPRNGAILVLDDAFITGARLSGYQKHLRYREFDGRVHYMVGLARPPSVRQWDIFRRRLSFRASKGSEEIARHTVQSVETILIPDWDHHQCPWCKEEKIYRRQLMLDGTTEGFFARRLKLLQQSRANGLLNDLFIRPEKFPALGITSGSIFVDLPASQAVVFASVAGALQELRTTENKKGKAKLGSRQYPIATILDYTKYLTDTYTDSVLRAAFLRGAEWEELVYTNQSKEEKKAKAAHDIIMSNESTEVDLIWELYLAILEGKFPRLRPDPGIIGQFREYGVQVDEEWQLTK